MSRTYKDRKKTYDYFQDRIYISEVGYYYQLPSTKPLLKRSALPQGWFWYRSTPSWWTRMTMNKPYRRAAKLLERKAIFSDVEEFDFPDLKKKPHIYYW